MPGSIASFGCLESVSYSKGCPCCTLYFAKDSPSWEKTRRQLFCSDLRVRNSREGVYAHIHAASTTSLYCEKYHNTFGYLLEEDKCNSLIFNSLSTGFAAAGSLFASCAAYKLAQSVGDVTAVYASSTIFVVILAWAFLGVNVFLLKKATNCHTEDHKFLAL